MPSRTSSSADVAFVRHGSRAASDGVRNASTTSDSFRRTVTRAANVVWVAVAICFAGLPRSHAYAYEPADLVKVASDLRAQHVGLAQLEPHRLSVLQSRAQPVALFDVREEEEFAVSRIAGAMHIDPAVSTEAFLNRFGGDVAGRTVVFYCSVGVRSSKLAQRVKNGLMMRGAQGVYNLESGLFGWHNEGRALVNSRGATNLVHPYNEHWGGLIARQDLVSTSLK